MTLPAAQPAPASEAIQKTGTATVDPFGGVPGKAKDGEGRNTPDAGLRSLDHCTFAYPRLVACGIGDNEVVESGSRPHALEDPAVDV